MAHSVDEYHASIARHLPGADARLTAAIFWDVLDLIRDDVEEARAAAYAEGREKGAYLESLRRG